MVRLFEAPNRAARRLAWLAALLGLGLAISWLPLPSLVALFAGSLLVTLLLIYPVFSIYLLIPLIPFSPLLAVSVGGVKIGGMEALLAVGLVSGLVRLSRYAPRSIHPPLRVPFLLFLGGVSFSWLNSLSLAASLVETAKWVEMLALYLLIMALLPPRQLKMLVAILLLAGLAQAGLGLYQFIFKVGPAGFLLFDGRFLRAYGTFAQPNPYAGYLGLVLPLALALLLWSLERRAKSVERRGSQQVSESANQRIPWRAQVRESGNFTLHLPSSILPSFHPSILPAFLFLSLLAALFASQSRGAWLGFAVAAAAVLLVYSRRTAALLAGLVLAVALAALAGSLGAALVTGLPAAGAYQAVLQRFVDAAAIVSIPDVSAVEVNDANFATIERLAHWQAARDMWRDHPWLGVGFGNYDAIYPAYAVGRWLNSLGHAHNYLLNIGAEAGLVGLLAYLIFWAFAFRITYLSVCRSNGFYRAVAAGGLSVLVHLHVHNFFDNLYVQGMYLHVAIILAVISLIYANPAGVTGGDENIVC